MAEAQKKAAAKPAKEAKAKAPKATSAAKGQIKVTQIGSPIGRRHDQEATLIGLGLNKRHKSRVLQDTPAIRGMINKVQHLVVVDEAK